MIAYGVLSPAWTMASPILPVSPTGVQPMCAALYEKLTQTAVNRAKTEKGKDVVRARYKDGEIKAIASVILVYRSRKQ
jgi:hypothetical protein